jgi:uncharacterized protein YndB with AHSA1/START domain
MISVRDSTWIDAPREAVFDALDRPDDQPRFTPSLETSTLIERLPNGGSRVAYTFRLLGLPLSGEVRATDYDRPERIVWALSGDLQGSIRWYLDPERGGTRFTYAATYALPGPAFLEPVTAPIVRRYNDREVTRLLKTFKRLVETGALGPTAPAGA